MADKPTQQEFVAAVESEPTLCGNGMRHLQPLDEFKAKRAEFIGSAVNYQEFVHCVDVLSQCTITKTPALNSYYLKHVVERKCGEYISNGALIAAVKHLGIKLKYNPNSPNIGVAISEKCPVILADKARD